MHTHVTRTLRGFVVILGCGALVACGPSPEQAMQSHRLGVDAWQTVDITEAGRDLHVTVAVRHLDDPVALASRIVEQRRAQGWQTIRVTLQPQDGQEARTVVARHPYGAANISAQ